MSKRHKPAPISPLPLQECEGCRGPFRQADPAHRTCNLCWRKAQLKVLQYTHGKRPRLLS